MSPMSTRRVGVASGLVVALAATSLTFFAVTSRGETVHEADLSDGGVWVSSAKDARFARVNKAVGQFDAGVVASSGPGEPVDVLQDDNAVAGLVVGSGELTPIEPKSGRLSESGGVFVSPPRVATNQRVFVPASVDLRGGTVAEVSPATGKVWGETYDAKAGLGALPGLADGARTLATVGAVSAMAVDVKGNIHVVSGATGKVVTIPRTPTGFGTPVTATIALKDAKVVDITAVGTRWVVYSAGDDKLYFQGSATGVDAGTTREEGKPAYAALQQPGPDADSVGLQDSTTLRLIGKGGATGTGGVQVTIGDDETPPLPSRPLRTGACIHAAWASVVNNYYGKDCGGSGQPAPAVSIERKTAEPVRSGVSLRTNHGLVVLNDLDGGEVWDLDSKPKKLDEWDSLIPPPKTTKDTKKKDENLIDETSVNQPPTAKPDNLKARPGRTSKLHVLDNDTDAAGSVLAIAPDDLGRPDLAGVTASVAADGQSIDVAVPDDPERQSFSFTYKVNNGKSPQRPQAKVTVTLVPDEVNSPPTLRPGTANLTRTIYPVIRGKVLPVQVIGDWRDPESDSLSLEAVAAGSSVDGLGRLNVLAPMKTGTQGVEYSVNDGRVGSKGTVTVKVLGQDDSLVKPKTQPDVVRGVVGKPLQLEPLGNDIPGADPTEPDATLRLSRELQSTGALAVDTNLDTGVVTVTGSTAGTFELSYGAQVGGGIAAGRVRVDLIADPDPDAPPVAVPDAATLRDQTPVLTDVLANDYSPRADVLVTRSVSVSADSAWLRPSIYQGRWVRIEALDPAGRGSRPRTGTVTYTISDGVKTTTGEVAVSQFPADDRAVPVVGDDQAVVRAQDTVTIPVMDNDSMADGIPLVLDPATVKVIDGAGVAFASGNVVRFVPEHQSPTVQETVTVEYAVYPIGDRAKSTTGRITIAVLPLPTAATPNQAPVARSFSTSVTAGDPLTITVPSSGVDPDGDSVTVAGLVGAEGGAVDLKFGRVTGFGPSTIKYEAYPTAAGTEVLHYEVRDRFGATSQGFVRIGVVQPGDPQPPVAVEDEVRAKPGKTVTVDATLNDLIARGDSIDLEYKAPLNPAAELAKWKVDEANTYFTTTVPAPQAGVQHLTYGISNGLFDPSRSTISVVPDPTAKNPPVAVDDTAKPTQGETSTVVDALANDRDIDGTRESLKITSVLSPDGAIEGNGTQVRVKVKAFPYTVPYVITDEDGLTAMALIYVPTGESGLPFVVSGALIEMDQDSTKTIKLADYVKSPRARVVSITTADNVSASPTERLRVEADGRSGLTLTSSGGYIGPGAVMLEVSDQELVSQKDFKTAYLSIPVQIGPKIPLLRCPDYTVKLNAGGRARTVDIPTLCHAWLPVGMTLDDVVFESSWRPEPKDVDLRRSGAGDRTLELRAGNRAPSSINGRLVVKARGGPESTIAVSVFGIDGGAVDANGNPLPSLGLPRLRPFSVSGLEAGSSRTVNLQSYLDSPLESPSCSISAASVPAGSGLTVSRSGCDLTLTAGANARGRTVVDVSVADGPGRNAPGRGTVEILGKPDAPTAVAAEADRVSGGSARVRWLPPAIDGGSPITGYVVRVKGSGGREVSCSASPCTISDLRNGESYTFSVVAVNAIGRSPESSTSNAVVPDTLPNPVNGVRMAGRGDGSLTIAWDAPAKKGSDVTTYDVRVTDTSTGAIRSMAVSAPALRTTVTGLTNDHQQSVQVRAKNKLGYGPFGQPVRMQSAGTPPAVPAPRVDNAGTGPAEGSSTLTISWDEVRPNGPPLTQYTVYESRNSGAWTAIGTRSPDQRSLGHTTVYDGASYRYVVTATNGANKTGPKANPTTFSSVGIPQVPGRPSVTTPRADHSATVRVSVGDSRSGSFTQLQWRTSVGRTETVSCGCPENSTKQFGIAGLGTSSSQTLQVRAYNGKNWSDWSSPSNSYRAYGQTPAPSGLTASRSGNDITWTWNNRTDGRAIQNVQVSLNGGGWQGLGGPRESYTRSNLSPGTYNLRVRTIANRTSGDEAGGVGTWQYSAPAGPAGATVPQDPKVTVLKGSSCSQRSCNTGNGSCTTSGCAWIKVRTENFNGGVTCTFRENGSTVNGWRNLSMGGNDTKESDNFYGGTGRVTAICDGVSGSLDW